MINPFRKFFEKRKKRRICQEVFDDTVIVADWLKENNIVLSRDITVSASTKPHERQKLYIIADDDYIKTTLSNIKLPIISERSDNIKRFLPEKSVFPDNSETYNVWAFMTDDNYQEVIELFVNRDTATSKKQKFLYDAATMLMSVICKSMVEQNELSWAAFSERLEASKLEHPEFVTTLIDFDIKMAFEAFKSTINNKEAVYDIICQTALSVPKNDTVICADDIFKPDSLIVLNSGKGEKTTVERCNQFIIEKIFRKYTNYPSVAVVSKENYILFFIRNKYGKIYDVNLKIVFSRNFNMTDTYDASCMLITKEMDSKSILSMLNAIGFNCQYYNEDVAPLLSEISKTDCIMFPLTDKNKKLFKCKKGNEYEEKNI